MLGADEWTRERYPLDADGEVDLDAAPATLLLTGCSVQPGAPQEVLQGREATRIAYTAWCPPGFDVRGSDFARFGGHLYRVAGEPQRWCALGADHDVILFERWEG